MRRRKEATDYNPYRWEYTVLTAQARSYRICHYIWEVKKGQSLCFDYINDNRWSEDYWRLVCCTSE